jgi:hypothetical protein
MRAMVISSKELMIINTGYCFLTATWLLPPGCVFVKFLLQVPKGKEGEEKKERRCVVLGINILVFFYSLL